MPTELDFGYPWWISYGHLILTAILLAVLLLGYKMRWSRWLMVPLAVVTLWSISAFLVARFALDINGRAKMPTEAFLRSGHGRVLDIGAGTGRSSLMVLEARPNTTVVALDLFGKSYVEHFGAEQTPGAKLMANLKAAGVDQRASVQAGDMRKLPFEPASFDAIVSSYAIDHLNREGIEQALAEASRVVKPGGEFLLMIIGKDPWLQYTFGPLLLHAGTRGAEWWTSRLETAGFQVTEHGTRPGTLYLLARKRE